LPKKLSSGFGLVLSVLETAAGTAAAVAAAFVGAAFFFVPPPRPIPKLIPDPAIYFGLLTAPPLPTGAAATAASCPCHIEFFDRSTAPWPGMVDLRGVSFACGTRRGLVWPLFLGGMGWGGRGLGEG